jgi:hypothetical protein
MTFYDVDVTPFSILYMLSTLVVDLACTTEACLGLHPPELRCKA